MLRALNRILLAIASIWLAIWAAFGALLFTAGVSTMAPDLQPYLDTLAPIVDRLATIPPTLFWALWVILFVAIVGLAVLTHRNTEAIERRSASRTHGDADMPFKVAARYVASESEWSAKHANLDLKDVQREMLRHLGAQIRLSAYGIRSGDTVPTYMGSYWSDGIVDWIGCWFGPINEPQTVWTTKQRDVWKDVRLEEGAVYELWPRRSLWARLRRQSIADRLGFSARWIIGDGSITPSLNDQNGSEDMPKSLKDARNEGDLEGFIKEHEKDAPGDSDKLEDAIMRPASAPENGSTTPKTSRPASSGD